MTLRLVPNVEQLPVNNMLDVANCAREFADDIEAGKFGHVRCALIVIDTVDGMHQLSWGESISNYEAVGILDVAKRLTYESNFEDDD